MSHVPDDPTNTEWKVKESFTEFSPTRKQMESLFVQNTDVVPKHQRNRIGFVCVILKHFINLMNDRQALDFRDWTMYAAER